ncbi:hypothetical protein SK128_012834 [Halocaridina rubra]|uniref:Uncharacterized protein n=1 Tax=Halocaridina rubra TaxID=373956 RepID=A0AAN9A4V7_HALRR
MVGERDDCGKTINYSKRHDMFIETNRLTTFLGENLTIGKDKNVVIENRLKPTLAMNGFFYIRERYIVCVCCQEVHEHGPVSQILSTGHKSDCHFPTAEGCHGNVSRDGRFCVRGYQLQQRVDIHSTRYVYSSNLKMTFSKTFDTLNKRIKSFDLFKNIRFGQWESFHSGTKMAMAGFHYTGTADKVMCFYCGGSIMNWSDDDDIIAEHVKWFPHCLFAQLVNFPSNKSFHGQFLFHLFDLIKEFKRIESLGLKCIKVKPLMTNSQNYRIGDSEEGRVNDIDFSDKDLAKMMVQEDRTFDKQQCYGLNRETDRRSTFKNFNKRNENIEAKGSVLASKGFIYQEGDNTIQCVFCDASFKVSNNWSTAFYKHDVDCAAASAYDRGNVPFEMCDVVKQINKTSNGFMIIKKIFYEQQRERRIDLGTRTDSTFTFPQLGLNDISIWQRFGNFSTKESRLTTFADKECYIFSPKEMAAAGFLSVFRGDSVVCHYCGGGLRNWQLGDDPLALHLLFYPYCDFAHMMAAEGEFDFYGTGAVNNFSSQVVDWQLFLKFMKLKKVALRSVESCDEQILMTIMNVFDEGEETSSSTDVKRIRSCSSSDSVILIDDVQQCDKPDNDDDQQ